MFKKHLKLKNYKDMKYRILILLFIGSLIASCSDMLEEKTYDQVQKNGFMLNAKEAKVTLLGVYRPLVSNDLYAYNLSVLFNLSTDIAQCEGSSTVGFREIPTNAFSSSNVNIERCWKGLYNAIYTANSFIETLSHSAQNFKGTDRELARIYLGEARTLRALYYFELVRWYGNIILIKNTKQSYDKPATFVQADPVEVYKFIEEDLLFAADVLPYAVDDVLRSDLNFRMSKGSALGLLTKVYATWAGAPIKDETKWEKAVNTAQILINSGKHGLLNAYETLWKNTCNSIWDSKESLIEVSFFADAVTGSRLLDPCGRIGKWNGVRANTIPGERGRNSGVTRVVYTFMQNWENKDNDKRYDISIADYYYKGRVKTLLSLKTPEQDPKNWQRCTPGKWDTEKYVKSANSLLSNDYSNINWYILRYADVLLLYAEALNESKGGPTPEAIEAVNMVRRRGYGLPVGELSSVADITSSSQEDFRKLIQKERAYELAFEGHRKQDLLRWGIYVDRIRETAQNLLDWYSGANYTVVEYTEKNKNELLPIPLRDKDMMPQVKQNPGWN